MICAAAGGAPGIVLPVVAVCPVGEGILLTAKAAISVSVWLGQYDKDFLEAHAAGSAPEIRQFFHFFLYKSEFRGIINLLMQDKEVRCCTLPPPLTPWIFLGKGGMED